MGALEDRRLARGREGLREESESPVCSPFCSRLLSVAASAEPEEESLPLLEGGRGADVRSWVQTACTCAELDLTQDFSAAAGALPLQSCPKCHQVRGRKAQGEAWG